MDDRELALIAAFRLHEVASRLGVLSRMASSRELKDVLRQLSEQLAEHEANVSKLGQGMPTNNRGGSDTHLSRNS